MKQKTILDFKAKKNKEKITMLTCYDYSFAKIISETDLDIVLVGDSLGNVVLGYENTLPVTLRDMISHCKAVRRGLPNHFIVIDMPFMSYQISEKQALKNAGMLMKKTNSNAVKLEGGKECCKTIEKMVISGIPVMGHIGLTPQSVNQLGGFKIQGKTQEDYKKLIEDAIALEEAGAFSIVIECVPKKLAEEITNKLSIPTLGIGAGNKCDGQVLVINDMLGLNSYNLKHNRKYLNLYEDIKNATNNYISDVKNSSFPNDKESFE